MKFSFAPMNEADAVTIQQWHYDEPYAIYNPGADLEDGHSELLDPHSPYYAVRDEQGELIGFFGFGTSAQPWDNTTPRLYTEDGIIDIGLGMRPDMVGRGLGLSFVSAGLAFAREHFAPRAFRLFVLTFNERAIRVYEQAGFARIRVFVQHNIHGELTFLEMRCEA